MGDRIKPDGDVRKRPEDIEQTQREAHKQSTTPDRVCQADHSSIRGRRCGYCGTYFRGDDMG